MSTRVQIMFTQPELCCFSTFLDVSVATHVTACDVSMTCLSQFQ